MALQINTNVAALNAQRNLSNTNRSLGVLFEQLSSGLRVNRAADDAAGLAISEKMRAQIKGMQQGQRNAQDGISMLQTTEGALNEVHSILQRIRELSVQAGNTTLSSSDRQAIGEEMLALRSEIDNIGTRTRFNGQQLLNGSLAVTLDAPGSTADNATAVANGATVSVSTIDVGRAIGAAAYTLASAAGNLTLSHDDGTGYIISQTVAVNAMGANAEQSIAFDRLGVTIDVTHDANAGNVTGATIAAAFNGTTINTSASSNASFRVGADSGDNIGIAFEDMRASALGDTNKLSGLITNNNAVSTTTKADTLLLSVDAAIAQVSTFRAKLGASQNQMERPISRDSDFYVRYRGIDPALYSLLVCPGCGYTAYHDDFDDLNDDERAALEATREERVSVLERSLCGIRTPEDNVVATDLALRCYAQRRPNDRRRAVLLHRRAWAERERGDAAAEIPFLSAAREAYQSSFERDAGISDESAVRAAYLIGDLWLRLGDPIEASRWLETAIRVPGAKNQSGLVRLARERLFDARQLFAEQRRVG